MREITFGQIADEVAKLTKACSSLTPSCKRAMGCALERERNSNAAFALEMLAENARVADVHNTGGLLTDAVDEGVRRGYRDNGYRASVLDPVTRINTRDNTPAVTHVTLVEGDKMELTFLPKGFGSENMSRLYMLTPSAGMEGVKNCILEAVRLAGSNPCPPMVIGVGIGGTAEKAMLLAKEQLLREVGAPSEDSTLAELEREMLSKINALGIGAQGFGGDTTAIGVHIVFKDFCAVRQGGACGVKRRRQSATKRNYIHSP